MITFDILDRKIMSALHFTPLHSSALSRKIGESRTTIVYRLKRLSQHGYTKKTIVGRKSVWTIVERKLGSKSHIQIFKGTEMMTGYRQLFNLAPRTILLCAQGAGAVRGQFRNLPAPFIMNAHRVFKRKKITLKGLTNVTALKEFRHVGQTLLKSHLGRSLGVKIFNDHHLLQNSELMSAPDFLFIGNPVKKRVVILKDKDITGLIYEILSLLFELMEKGPNFDLNTYLKKTHIN
ncbi:MAG: winged helix-turn-helix domain-containing protein [Patescibacteria group bacterium]